MQKGSLSGCRKHKKHLGKRRWWERRTVAGGNYWQGLAPPSHPHQNQRKYIENDTKKHPKINEHRPRKYSKKRCRKYQQIRKQQHDIHDTPPKIITKSMAICRRTDKSESIHTTYTRPNQRASTRHTRDSSQNLHKTNGNHKSENIINTTYTTQHQ